MAVTTTGCVTASEASFAPLAPERRHIPEPTTASGFNVLKPAAFVTYITAIAAQRHALTRRIGFRFPRDTLVL